MNSHAAPVTVESDVTVETVCLRLTAAEKKFVEQRARAELRTVSNYLRTLIADQMSG
jgi:hypothetical protein